MKPDNALIIFVKNPEKGKVKTRLAKTIGEERALAVYNGLLSHTLDVTVPLPCDKAVYYSDFIPGTDIWSLKGYRREQQTGHDLGQRMCHAFERELKNGYKSICIIGSDCPGLSATIIAGAFDMLRETEIIIGPSSDGGYYLLGMHQLQRQFFLEKPWGTSRVFADTLKDIKALGMKYRLLPVLTDIDEEKDLRITNFKEKGI